MMHDNLSERNYLIEQIRDLEYKKQELELQILKKLLTDDDLDCLSINWTMVYHKYSFPRPA